MNAVTISGIVLKVYGDVLQMPAPRLFVRVVVQNKHGVFVAVGYDDVARTMAGVREGMKVVVHGFLRQRKPNGKTLWEIVTEQILCIGENGDERMD